MLVTESILALPFIRSLGALSEVSLHTLSAQNGSRPISERSRFITSRHRFDSAEENKEERINELLAVIEKTEADILLPVDEEYVRWVILLKSRLKQHVRLPPLPSLHLFDTLIYKNRLSRLLKMYNFPCASVHSIEEASSMAGDTIYPCLLKPVRGASGYGIKKVKNRFELIEYLNEIDAEGYMLQEYIPGEDIGCSLLAAAGELKAFTVPKKVHGEELGVATAIRFIKDEAIADYVRRLVRITGYSGWANLDFRRDRRDGQVKLIDFNARFWLCMSGSRAAGVDFSRLICRAALQEDIEFPSWNHITWHMGSSTFRHYWKKLVSFNGNHSSHPVHTDLWERISDPMPEIARYME